MTRSILAYFLFLCLAYGIASPELHAQSYDNLKAALAAPRKATGLTLRDARLKKLPPEIKKLGNLRSLLISCPTQIEGLPSEIGNLARLERLVIDSGDRCQMKISPPESIGKLRNLKVLKLHGVLDVQGSEAAKNGKSKPEGPLPKSLSQLTSLMELDLGGNGLAEVPPQIAGLEKLEKLLLDHNPLTGIPPFVAKLKKLKELSLVSTRVAKLPQEFSATKGLKIAMGDKTATPEEQAKLKADFPNITFNFGELRPETAAKTSAPAGGKTSALRDPNYRVIFTTGLNESNEPVNNIGELSLDEKTIYIYVTWFSLPRAPYQYVCKIYDGAGDLVRLATMDFTPNDDSHYTFSAYQIRKALDKPGQWKFEIYLNGIRVIDKSIRVVSS